MSQKRKQASAKRAEPAKNTASAAGKAPGAEKNRLFFPVLLALTLVPLLVHLVIVSVDPNEAAQVGTAAYGDFFSRAKAFVLLLIGIAMLVLGIVFRRKFPEKRGRVLNTYLIAGGAFALFTLLSAAFSGYASIAFWGAHDRAEGAVTILCYLVLLFYSIYAYRTERDSRNIVIALGIVVSVCAFLGVFQFFGHDLLFTDFGKALTTAPWDRDKVTDMYSLSQSGRLYGTFFHRDYMGSFAGIVFPMFLALACFAKSLRSRIALWGMTLLSLWLLLGSTSRAGLVGVFAALVFCAVFFGKKIVRHWKISAGCAAAVLVAFIGLNAASGDIYTRSRIPSLFSDIAGIFQSGGADYLPQLPVKDVSAQGNTAVVVTQKNDMLKATLNDHSMSLKDQNGQKISVETKDGNSAIADERFKQFNFKLVKMGLNKDSKGIALFIDGQPQFFFRIGSDQTLHLTNAAGTKDIDSLKTPPSFGFQGKERLGSARGYIWSRTLPMLPGHLLLGAGPDTFVLNFPQDDLLGKYWAYGTTNMIVDKPHNLYLQIMTGEGGVALLAFLLIVLLYVIDSIRLYALKKEYRQSQVFGAAACFGVVGYLFAGLFNDSVVSVAPVFWIVLGVGIAVNFQNRRELSGHDAS